MSGDGRRLAAVIATLSMFACSGRMVVDDPRSVMTSERLLACDTLVSELRALDVNASSEAELVDRMEAARSSEEVCARMWTDAAETPGEAVIAAQEARQLPLQALLIESALSARFDDMFGYCEILEDAAAILFAGLREVEAALDGEELTDGERARLVELRDLDLEGLDVLIVHRDENCD